MIFNLRVTILGLLMVVLAAATTAVHGANAPDIYFPPINVASKIIWQGTGNFHAPATPSAVIQGNSILCFLRAGKSTEADPGAIYLLNLDYVGNIASTQLVYQSGDDYMPENTVLLKTAVGSLLAFFDLYDINYNDYINNPLRVMRSTNGGTTWATTNTITTAPSCTNGLECGGKAIQVVDGKVLFPYYQATGTNTWRTAMLQSSVDDGLTWGNPVVICDSIRGNGTGANEPSLLSVGGSNVLCFIRGFSNTTQSAYLSRSTDAGTTWSTATNLWPCVGKIDPVYTANGLILVTYREPFSNRGAWRVSGDMGVTWTDERIYDVQLDGMSSYSAVTQPYPGIYACLFCAGDLLGTNDTLYLRYGSSTAVPPAGTITLSANPSAGGNVSGGGVFLPGSNITLTAVSNTGWSFLNWSDGVLNNPRSITVPVVGVTYTANFASTFGLGTALDATNLAWTLGGNAAWYGQTGTKHGTVSAAQSGVVGAGQTSSLQVTTNGPASLQFWWKVSSAPTNCLQFYINTQLVSQISGNVDWNQVVTFLGTSNQVTLTWVYTKNSATISGSDAGWVDQVAWTPCPYAEHVPQMFYQDPSGLLASWVLDSTGGIRFARIIANTGGWALKAAGDVDGDGVSDLLFETAGGDIGGWFMNADGSVRDARFWFNIGGWEIKACGDFEGTGHGQMFFQNAAGVAAYWRLDTNGNFQSAVILGNMVGWKLRGAGDLDGDHKAELFWQNAAGQVAIWSHNPTNDIISGAVPFSTGPWALCGVTDIDGDGVSDLLWQTPAGDVGGWIMNSNSTARAANFWWNTGVWKLKAAGR